MTGRRPGRPGRCIHWVAVALGALACLATPGRVRPAPLNRPPIISITAVDLEGRRAEARLARFLRDLQLGRREKAAALFSSRIGPELRADFIAKRWLPARLANSMSAERVLFWPDLKIHTQEVFRDARRLCIGPRHIPYNPGRNQNRAPAGFLQVRMRREGGEWMVELNPPRRP